MNSIHHLLGSVSNYIAETKLYKSQVKILYVEVDEDYISFQDGDCIEPKLVYVHEGKKQFGKERWELVNARYFSDVYSNSAELWEEIRKHHHFEYWKKNLSF